MEGGNPGRALKRSVLSLLASQAATSIGGALTGVLAARLLGPGGRGLLAAVFTWPCLLLTVLSMGIPQAPAYFVASRPQRGRAIYATFLALVALQTAVLYAAGIPLIGRVFTGTLGSAVLPAHWYLLAMPLAAMGGVYSGILQGRLQVDRLNLLRLAPVGTYLIGLAALGLLGIRTVEAVTMLLILQLAVGAALGHFLAAGGLRGPLHLDSSLSREIFGYSMKTQLSHGAQVANLRLDQLAMSMFIAPSELGIYAVACAAPTLITLASSALAIVVLPDIARRSLPAQGATLIRYFRINLLVLCGLALAGMAFAPVVVPLLYGGSFCAAVLPAQILCAGAVFQGTNDVLGGGLRGMQRPGIVAASQGFSIVVTGVGLYALLPIYGASGAAITSLLAYGATSVLLVGALLKGTGTPPQRLLPTTADLSTLAGVFRRQRHSPASGEVECA